MDHGTSSWGDKLLTMLAYAALAWLAGGVVAYFAAG